MAGLPGYTPGEPTGEELVRNIGVVRPDSYEFGGGAARGFDDLASAAGRVAQFTGDIAEQEGVAQSIRAGTKAAASLQRDPSGNLQPLPWADDSSPENRAYNVALQTGAIASFENDQRVAAAKYRAQAPFDPDGFATLWQGHTEGTLAGLDPRLAPLAQAKLGQIGTETQNGIIDATRQRTLRVAETDWTASLQQKENDLYSLASAGEIQHPAYQQAMNDYLQTLNSGVASKFIGPEDAAARRMQVADTGEAQAISFHALGAYQAAGGGPAAEQAALDTLKKIDDPALHISPERRRLIEDTTLTRIRQQQSIKNQQARTIWEQQGDPTLQKVNLGIAVDPGQVASIQRSLVAAGDTGHAALLDGAAQFQQQRQATGALPIPEQQARLDALTSKMDDGTATVADAHLARALPDMMRSKARALLSDPLSYGVQAHADMTGPLAPVDFTQDPQTVATQIAARAAQAQKVSAYEGVFVPPLTTPELRNIANTIVADPANAPARLDSLQKVSGAAWPSVWKGLATMGGLPPEFQAVGSVDDPQQAALLARGLSQGVARDKDGVVKENPKVLTDLLPADVGSGIAKDVGNNNSVQQYLASLSKSGSSAAQVNAVLGSIKTLAYSNAVYGGADRATAVDNAVSAFTSKFEYLPGAARVPAHQFAAVSANAQVALGGLKAAALAVPARYGKPGQPSADDYVRALQNGPSWITSPDGDALMLVDNGGRLVRLKNGQPLRIPFDAPAPPSVGDGYAQDLIPGD